MTLSFIFIIIGFALLAMALSAALHKRTRHKKFYIKGQPPRYYTVWEWMKIKAKQAYEEKKEER